MPIINNGGVITETPSVQLAEFLRTGVHRTDQFALRHPNDLVRQFQFDLTNATAGATILLSAGAAGSVTLTLPTSSGTLALTGGGGGNSFTIMQPITGTSPTAGSTADTLTFASSDSNLSIAGNSGTKTLDFTLASTITGAKTFSSAITASLTGAASLNVLKAGDTMTGPLNMPAGSASTAEITGGTSNTGFFFPSSSTAAFTSAGTELWRTGSGGITIGNTTAQTARLYVTSGSGSDTGIVLESGTTAGRKMALDFSGANVFFIGKTGTNYFLSAAHTATGGTGANWFSMGAGGGANPPAWPQGFECISADGNVTSITATAFTPLAGASVNGSPSVVLRNRNSTANTLAVYGTTGSSGNMMVMFGSRHVVQTASSEDSEVFFANRKAGTLTESLTINKSGQVIVQQAGAGLSIKTGSNCKMGTSVLVAGTVTVSTTAVTASSIIFLTHGVAGGTLGTLSVGTITAGTSFVINSSNAADTSTVNWLIMEPS